MKENRQHHRSFVAGARMAYLDIKPVYARMLKNYRRRLASWSKPKKQIDRNQFLAYIQVCFKTKYGAKSIKQISISRISLNGS